MNISSLPFRPPLILSLLPLGFCELTVISENDFLKPSELIYIL